MKKSIRIIDDKHQKEYQRPHERGHSALVTSRAVCMLASPHNSHRDISELLTPVHSGVPYLSCSVDRDPLIGTFNVKPENATWSKMSIMLLPLIPY